MNSSKIATLLLWLFVINLGIAFGAGLYEHRIVVPRWVEGTEAISTDDTGRQFWAFVTTGPLTLLTLANLVVARRALQPVRSWWFGAALVAFVERLFTFFYFIPTMISLMNTPDSPDAAATAQLWSNLNYLRHALVIVAWLAALKAFALLYETRQNRSALSERREAA